MSDAIRILEGRFGRVVLLEASTPLTPHAHPEHLVLIKHDGADACYRIAGCKVALTRRDIVFVNAREVHDNCRADRQAPTRLLSIYLSAAWLAETFPATTGAARLFPCCGMQIPSHVRQMADALVAEMLRATPHAVARMSFLLNELVVGVLGRFARPHAQRRSLWKGSFLADRRIRHALDTLRERPARGDSIESLAAAVGLSRSRFYDLFETCTGLSPGVYADMLRVQEAIRRLAGGKESIATLAADLGFSAQGNFTRFFVQHIGVTPSHYRRAIAHMDMQ